MAEIREGKKLEMQQQLAGTRNIHSICLWCAVVSPRVIVAAETHILKVSHIQWNSPSPSRKKNTRKTLKFAEHEDVSRFKRMVGYKMYLLLHRYYYYYALYVDVWCACAPNSQFNSSEAIFWLE